MQCCGCGDKLSLWSFIKQIFYRFKLCKRCHASALKSYCKKSAAHLKVFNQDVDRVYVIKHAFYLGHYYGNVFYGYNVYGIENLSGKRIVLGTYDEETDAKQVVEEIIRFINQPKPINDTAYTLPQSVLEEEIFEEGEYCL